MGSPAMPTCLPCPARSDTSDRLQHFLNPPPCNLNVLFFNFDAGDLPSEHEGGGGYTPSADKRVEHGGALPFTNQSMGLCQTQIRRAFRRQRCFGTLKHVDASPIARPFAIVGRFSIVRAQSADI
jgi:hypothetical protein